MCGWTSNNEKYWFEASLSGYYSLSSGSTRRRELSRAAILKLTAPSSGLCVILSSLRCSWYSDWDQIQWRLEEKGLFYTEQTFLEFSLSLSFVSVFFFFFCRWRPGTVLDSLANVGFGFFFFVLFCLEREFPGPTAFHLLSFIINAHRFLLAWQCLI